MDQRQFDNSLRSLAKEEAIPVSVSGNCMQPLFSDGAFLEIKPAKIYWPGDILVFRRWDNQLISHRLLSFYYRNGKLKFLTQPDNGPIPDSSISSDQILGKVTGGECQNDAVNIPLKSRIIALKNFFYLLILQLKNNN